MENAGAEHVGFGAGAVAKVLAIGPAVDARAGVDADRAPAIARAAGIAVERADVLSGLHAFVRALPDLVVIDALIPEQAVNELVQRLRELSDVPIVVVRGGTPASARLESEIGAVHPVAPERAEAVVAGLLREIAGARADASAPVGPITAAQVRRDARTALRARLEHLLVECRGNLAEVARRMGKDRSTIRYHLRRFGMLVEDERVWAHRSVSTPSGDLGASA